MHMHRDGHLRLGLASLVLAIALFGCGSDEPGPEATTPGAGDESPVEIRVTDAVDGGSTALRVGQVLRVELPANPQAGCMWQVESVDENTLRRPDMEEYLPPEADGEEQAGTSLWRFEARAAGRTTLKLRYACVSDDPQRPEATFTFTVIVD